MAMIIRGSKERRERGERVGGCPECPSVVLPIYSILSRSWEKKSEKRQTRVCQPRPGFFGASTDDDGDNTLVTTR